VTALRVVAFAGGAVGVEMLDRLARRVLPVGVVASHAGRGAGTPCPFTVAWCERHGVLQAYWPRVDDDGEPARWLAERAPGLLLSLSYDLILPAALLAAAPRAVNVHRGLAPEFRGAYSTIWALERGAREVGVTIHEMVAEVDAGAIIARRALPTTPETTAAEAIPLVERAAVALLDEVLDDLLADRLSSEPQPPGGESFGRELPPAELDGDLAERVARRSRARFNPPYPPAQVALGIRRFGIVELPPTVAYVAPPAASPVFVPAPCAENAPAFARGLNAIWTATAEAAAALALDGPVALPELATPALEAAVRAAGVEVVRYKVGADLDPDAESLARAATGRTVVLTWVCGRPPSSAVRELARRVGDRVIEDRTQALLDGDPILGDAAVVDLEGWTGSLDGGGIFARDVLSEPAWLEPDPVRLGERARERALAAEAQTSPVRAPRFDAAPRPISRAGAREALLSFDAPAARGRMERAAGRYMAAMGRRCPFTHWPPDTVAHGFPLLVPDVAERAAIDAALPGLVARPLTGGPRAEALIALPCHAGTTTAQVDGIVAALIAAEVR
jgi:methionyl-tRNA formyltransferase